MTSRLKSNFVPEQQRRNHEAQAHAKTCINNDVADGHVLQGHGLVEGLGQAPEQAQKYEIDEMAGNGHGLTYGTCLNFRLLDADAELTLHCGIT